MESIKQSVEDIFFNIEKATLTKLELWKLKTIVRASETISSFIAILVMYFIVTISFIILSIGAAFWLGHYWGNTSTGFFVVGGFYIALSLIIYLLRKQILKTPVQNHLIHKMTK